MTNKEMIKDIMRCMGVMDADAAFDKLIGDLKEQDIADKPSTLQDVVVKLNSQQDVDDLISDLRGLKRSIKKTGGEYRVFRTGENQRKAIFVGWY